MSFGGGFFGSGSSESSTSTDNRIDDDSVNLSDGDYQAGNFAEDSELSNISGASVEINVLDAGAIESAFEFAEESTQAVLKSTGQALDAFEDINKRSLDLADNINKSSFDAYSDISESSDNLIKSSLSILSDVVNSAFSFSSTAQSEAIEAIEKTTSDQSEMFSQSLSAVQQSASTAVTQGSNEIIKLVMMGLVGFGLVIAIFSGK